MIELKVNIKNLEAFKSALRKSPAVVGKHLQTAVEKSGYLFERETKDNIRSGRNMWKPPLKTSYMMNNIFTYISPFKAEIIPRADYSIYVHQGTSKMRARPYLEITMGTAADSINSLFAQSLESAINDLAKEANG